jgi:hypothetical protein
MKQNPYSGRSTVRTRRGRSITAGTKDTPRAVGRTRSGKVVASRMPLVNSDGEFNAYSKRDVIDNINALHSLVKSKQVKKVSARVADQRKRHVENAFRDKTGQTWIALGEVIGDEVWETLGRNGFARNTLLINELGKGEIGRLRVRRKDVIAYYAASLNKIQHSQVRQKYVFPPEVYLAANILIENKEIAQAPGDILEDKFQDGLEQIMVAEDRLWLRLARSAAPAFNDAVYFNTFTPTVFTNMRTKVAQWGIPVSSAIIAFDLWNDIIADSEFSGWFDPVTKHEIVMEGSLGSLQGVKLITDAYRFPTLKVLDAGELFFLGAPQTLGGITQRTPLSTEPINRYALSEPQRGWYMEQIEGMAITNPRAIVRGERV